MAAPSGTVWGTNVASTSGRQGKLGIYTKVTTSGSKVTANVQVWFWSIYSCDDTNNVFYYDVGTSITQALTNRGSVTIKHTVDTGAGWSTSNQTKIWEKTYTYTAGSSPKTYKVYAILANIDMLTAVDGMMQPARANASYTVPAISSYTVSYNANGGTGAPSSQTKLSGQSLTLSTVKPTRTGYTFQGWATSASGTVAYSPGATYTANAKVTLYAVWKVKTYAVKYNANGGTGAPSSQTKTHDKALTLSGTKPTRTNYTFKGWGTSSSATTVAYAASALYAKNASVTLYAIWTLSYKKPRISNLSVKRCAANGALTDEGTCAVINFDWASDKTATTVKIEWKLSSASSWSSMSLTAGGTGGMVNNTVIGNGTLNAENTYDIRVTVADGTASANTSTKTVVLAGTKFVVDFKAGGNGIAFGKAAEVDGYMDVGYKSRFRDSVFLDHTKGLYTYSSDGKQMALASVFSNDNTVFGYGSYNHSLGGTYLYGNNVSLVSKNTVNISSPLRVGGCRIAENKVLWTSTGYFMSASQTASLSEAISAQANGIVLVWSYYAEGASENVAFNMTFIPKEWVRTNSGKGMSMLLSTATGSSFALKYVYVSDTNIVGNDNNVADQHTTPSGIVTTPKSFVLRSVIGV